MADRDADLGQEQVHSYLWDTAQQGDTFILGKESKRSRTKRAKKAIKAVDHQFSNPSSAQQQGQGTHHNADLDSVGYQFRG
ncbi:hypothetical protein N8I77_003575 [Diaporthe amygdali]|uniref:Uncharacterized protein n=1 Tax=Phomopsis amygdali TaxID=1214568 RepID=A0AAD9W600_PHOAM|nr:hypothetical protein N8I77_003575 [Diaporthe amygdali]